MYSKDFLWPAILSPRASSFGTNSLVYIKNKKKEDITKKVPYLQADKTHF